MHGILGIGVIAEAVLRDLERKSMEHLQLHSWARFVDDMFVIIKREGKSRFLDVLNGFTTEVEENDCLPFLDALVTRHQDGQLRMTVHQKANRILHVNSNQPNVHMMACVRTSHFTTADAK